jgi:WXG100 family type VII secretion target
MANQVQVNYDEMRGIISKMKSEQAEVEALLKNTQSQVEFLHGNQWVGRGSNQFFDEMEQKYLPALKRLAAALGTSAEKAQKVVETIRQADEGTKSLFSNFG